MEYIKPKKPKSKVSFTISENTYDILALYAKYTRYTEDEVLDKFLLNLARDKNFIEWIKKQRNRKRMIAILEDADSYESIVGDLNNEVEETDSEG
jgi:hypothetical protein